MIGPISQSSAGYLFDSDAAIFCINANIVVSTQKKAIHNLVISLKNTGLWSKMKAIYPFVGGTEFSHKFNLKDPRDLNEAFRITWIGSLNGIHNNLGFTSVSNGLLGYYANSNMNHSISNFTLGNEHFSVYIQNNLINNEGGDIGSTEPSSGSGSQIYSLYNNLIVNRSQSNTVTTIANTNSSGFYTISRLNLSDFISSKNNSTYSKTSTASVFSARPIFIGAVNRGGTAAISNRTYSFASIGSGLTTDEIIILYSIIDTYQQNLNRKIL